MDKIKALLQELEFAFPKFEMENKAVSKATVGWHIEHSLLTINLIINAIKKSDPAEYRWKFNLNKTLVFAFNKIPRGRAKAPKVVQPGSINSLQLLQEHLVLTHKNLEELQALSKNHYFDHPYFGQLNLKPTIIFLEVHTNHHLKIIKEILSS